MTIEGAKLNFEEDISGSIEIGKKADLITLSADPYQINSKDLRDIDVTSTIIDGKVVYDQSGQLATL